MTDYIQNGQYDSASEGLHPSSPRPPGAGTHCGHSVGTLSTTVRSYQMLYYTCIRSGYCSPDTPTFAEQCANVDEQ